jgi:predicted Zn-dependent peptidase
MTVRLTRLANGFRVVTDRMEGVDTVSLGVWVDVGTRHEPAEINGVAHLLEHMAFKGTATRSAQAIAEEIEAVGGHLNAYTAREQTAYYAKVLKEDVGLAVDILADILQRSVFDAEELERERTVIIQEIGQANDTPDDVIFDLFQERAFPGQAMGRPVLGRPEIIARIPRDRVAGYMRETYAAGKMVLAAAGAVDHDKLVGLAASLFGELPAASAATTEVARYEGGEFREERELEQVHLVLGFPGVTFADPEHWSAAVLSTALGGGMSSRLFQEIRERRGLVYSIYTFTQSFRDGGVFGVYAGTGEDEVEELMPAMCRELVRATETMGAGELARARAQLKAGILMSLESTGARCEQLAQHLLVHGELLDPVKIVQRIEAVDEAAVRRVARRILEGEPTFTALGPLHRIEPFDRIRARLRA